MALQMTLNLPYRQIHLDFHTSPHIAGVGADFDPDEFADTLARAHVNSVTSFARCHHGMIYYESAAHPERVHPGLVRRDLLPAQIEACHRRGIRVPIYTTVQWDDFSADAHREWLCVDEEGRLAGTKPLQAGFYRTLDVFHPGYRQFLKDHIAEIFRLMPVDGLFLDIVQVKPSLARHWLDAMDDAGFDPEDAGRAPALRPPRARRLEARAERVHPQPAGLHRRLHHLLQRRPRRAGGSHRGRGLQSLRAGVAPQRRVGLSALPGRPTLRARAWASPRSA